MVASRLIPDAARRRFKPEYLLTLLLIGLGVVVFLPRLMSVVLIDHDDVISVIGATCNQARYEQFILRGQWVNASEWQQYWQMNGSLCFADIRDSLANYDIHPPLYFWLLHGWFSVFGVSILSGLVLNLVVLISTAIVIFATCRLLSVSNTFSFIAATAWMFSLPSRSAIGVIRQYTLFSFFTALLLLLVILWLKRGDRKYLFAISLVLAMGVLTHYQFPVAALAIVIFTIAILHKRNDRKSIAQLAGAGVAAFVIFYLVNPHFMESVWQADGQAQDFSLLGFGQRVGSVLATVIQLFNPLDWSHPLPFGLLDWQSPLFIAINILNLVVGAAAAFLAFRIVRKYFRSIRSSPQQRGAIISVENLPILAFCASWSAYVAMYIFFVSPVHSIGLQYLHFTTPMLFVGVAHAAQQCQPEIRRWVTIGMPAVIVLGAVFATSIYVSHRHEQERIYSIQTADTLLLDSTAIGILPSVLWHADPNTKVLASPQSDLIAQLPVASAGADQKLIFVNSTAYENSPEQRDSILHRLTELGYGDGVRQFSGIVPLIPLGGDIYVFENPS